MENKYTKFKEPIFIKQENDININLIGWYDRGSRAVVRGFITYNEDILDYICGVDKSQVEGTYNV